jgi:Flp pilus assembly protein TadD
VTSDDKDFVTYVRERLPNSFSLATRLPDQEWAAWVRAHGHDFSILSEAVNDLWCLSACDHLVHSRSGFSHFAILNSPKLDAATAHYVHVPALKEILDSLGPEEAVAWARGAVRKSNIHRHQQQYLFNWLADALDRAGRTDEAVQARRRGQWHWECTLHPVMDNSDKLAIEERARRRDFTGVLERAQRAVRELPGNPFWYSGYGGSLSYILAQMGRFEEAIAPARKAVEIEPEDAFLQEQLGFMLTHAGKLDEGEQVIRQAIAIDPELARFHGALGDNLMRQRRVPEATAAFREATRIEPDDANLIRRLGTALLQAGDYAGAEAAFRQALTLREEAGPYIELSDALGRQGRLAESLEQVRAAIALEPSNPHWHNRMSHVLSQSDRLAEAEAAARAAVQYGPDNVAFYDTLVITLQRQGRAEEALVELQRAAERAPQDVRLRIRLARAMVGAERVAEAEPLLQSAAEALPDLVDVHDLLSVVLEKQGRRAEAAEVARRAAALQPDDLGRRHRIARVLMEARDLVEAERVLREADPLAVKLGTFHHHHLLGVVLEWQGRLDDAIIEARKASDAEPRNPDLCGRVATMLLRAKQFDEAEVVARRALSLQPESEQLHRLLASIQQQRPQPAAPSPAAPEVAAAPPSPAVAEVAVALPSPVLREVAAALPTAPGSDIVPPAENPPQAKQRLQVRQWREGITASLRHLLTGISR